MSRPTVEEKGMLRHQLDKMSPSQWLAIVRWTLPQMLEDQELTTELICDEVDRRIKRYGDLNIGKELLRGAAMTSVLNDLSLCITSASKETP